MDDMDPIAIDLLAQLWPRALELGIEITPDVRLDTAEHQRTAVTHLQRMIAIAEQSKGWNELP